MSKISNNDEGEFSTIEVGVSNEIMDTGNSEIYSEIYPTNNQHTLKKYGEFVEEFKNSHYLISPDNEFIKYFIGALTKNIWRIEVQEIFYRARINYTDPYVEFNDNDLKAPDWDLVNHGRLNVKGIPYLYVSECKKTSISETRPYIGAKVSIGICRPSKELIVVVPN